MSAPLAPLPVERIESGAHAGVAIVRVTPSSGDPAGVVVLDADLIRRLELTLKDLPRSLTGLVLASTSVRVFVAGADLKAIQSLDDPDLERYLAFGQRVFGMLTDFACPTVAAINGAALGGGLELAMHCDALVGAPVASGKPYPIGLPEAGLAICPGWGGTALLPARMNPAEAMTRTAEGKTMTSDEAVAAGLFDRFAPTANDLLPTALGWIADTRALGTARRDGEPSRWIGRPERRSAAMLSLLEAEPKFPATDAASAVGRAIRAGLDGGWQDALRVERRELTRLRGTPAGKAAIQAFFDKGKK